MQTVVRTDVELRFCGSDARPGGGIVSLPHGICLAVAALDGLVEYFQHADIPIICVCVDDVGHPFEESVRAFVLIVNVEAWRRSGLKGCHLLLISMSVIGTTYLSGIRIVSDLSSRRTKQINDDVKPCIARPSTDLLQVMQSTLGKVFAVREDQIFTNPVSDRNPNSIQSVRLHLGDVILGGPCIPMLCPCRVGLSLPKFADAIKLGCCTAAAHAVPLIVGHPGLDDELRAETDPADWQGCW